MNASGSSIAKKPPPNPTTKRRNKYGHRQTRHRHFQPPPTLWKTGRRQRIEPAGASRPLLRLFWPQRRRQDHHHQMPSQFVAPHHGFGARVWPRPAKGGSRREIAPRLRARHRGVLPVDNGARFAQLPGFLPATLERNDFGGSAATLRVGPEAKDRQSVQGAKDA